MRRDTLIIFGVALAALAVGVFFFRYGPNGFPGVTFSAGADNHESSLSIVPFTKVAQGARSTVSTRANYIITSPDELSNLWELIGATTTPPKIDFEKSAVIAVFAGAEPASAITIARIEDTNGRMVSVAITKPDGACAGKAVTSPYEIIAVPATTLPLRHEDVLMTADCPRN